MCLFPSFIYLAYKRGKGGRRDSPQVQFRKGRQREYDYDDFKKTNKEKKERRLAVHSHSFAVRHMLHAVRQHVAFFLFAFRFICEVAL